jgi:hypothetical protein
VDAAAAARLWVDAWETGWRAHDPAPIAARYAATAEFRSHPFREPEDPRAYVERVFAEEEIIPEVWFGEPIVGGNRASVEYRATVRYAGRDHELAGVSVLRFDDEGLVIEHRDYWALEPDPAAVS